ncbi:glycosyltransferase [Lutibacter sp.]|uniref:glycosyltransferase n=1 Tax=Lutibacter sp. TaxID=1925666 RepID=UPI0025BA5465|nr:glycosyltransferase [Lutibacter sp.]MCF6180605.1 glycosyltransferase [Lutibacter sp.]
MLLKTPSIIKAIIKEKKLVADLIEKETISGVISDNRFGVYSKKIPSVFITHQLKVLSGNTTWITSKIHQYIIKKFDECWIPDVASDFSLSGKLSAVKLKNIKIKHIGILSRFKPQTSSKKHDILVLLSGVEPQRTLFENKILKELSNFKGNVVLVRGVMDNSEIKTPANFKVINYLLGTDLEKIIIASKLIIARSGYSTIMDLAVLNANVLFVPTLGQFEQEYLAAYLFRKRHIPFFKQHKIKFSDIKNLNDIGKFGNYSTIFPLEYFSFFERK